MAKKQQFRDKPEPYTYGQYHYENDTSDFDTFVTSSSVPKPYERFSDKNLETTVKSDLTRDYVIGNNIGMVGNSFIKINRLIISNRGVHHKVKNTYFRGFVFDRNTFDCFEDGQLKSYNDIDSALYHYKNYRDPKDSTATVSSRIYDFATIFNWNAPRYSEGRGPGELTFLSNQELISQLYPTQDPADIIQINDWDHFQSLDVGVSNFNTETYVAGDTTLPFPSPFNPRDSVSSIPIRLTSIFSDPTTNDDENYIQFVFWLRGDARRFVGTKKRRKVIAVAKILQEEFINIVNNNQEGTEERIDFGRLPYVSGGGGSTPAWEVSNFSVTIKTDAGVDPEQFANLSNQDIVNSITEKKVIRGSNLDEDLIDITSFDEVLTVRGGGYNYRKDFIPMVSVNVKNTNYNLQSYLYEDLQRQLRSTPNQVEIDVKITELLEDPNTGIRQGDIILTPRNLDNVSLPKHYKYCIVSWDDKENKFNSVEDVFNDKPTNLVEVLNKQRNNLYKFTDIYNKLINNYNTPGIKNIKIFLFSYVPYQNMNLSSTDSLADNEFEVLRYKLISTKIYLDIPINKYPDFGEVGGDDYTTLPWPFTTPIIGGVSEDSTYKQSVYKALSSGKLGDTDIVDEVFLQDDINNTEMGLSIQNFDLEQVRYFNKSYGLNNLLGLVYSPNQIGQRIYLTDDMHLETLVGFSGGGLIENDLPIMNFKEFDLFTEDGIISEYDVNAWINYGRPDIANFIIQNYEIAPDPEEMVPIILEDDLMSNNENEEIIIEENQQNIMGGAGGDTGVGGDDSIMEFIPGDGETPPGGFIPGPELAEGCINPSTPDVGGQLDTSIYITGDTADVVAYFNGTPIPAGSGVLTILDVLIDPSPGMTAQSVYQLTDIVFANDNPDYIEVNYFNPYSETNNDSTIDTPDQLPMNHVFLKEDGRIFYNIDEEISAYQFKVKNIFFTGVSGGDSEQFNFSVNLNMLEVPELINPILDFKMRTPSYQTGDYIDLNLLETNLDRTRIRIELRRYDKDPEGKFVKREKYLLRSYVDPDTLKDISNGVNWFYMQVGENLQTGYYKMILTQVIYYSANPSLRLDGPAFVSGVTDRNIELTPGMPPDGNFPENTYVWNWEDFNLNLNSDKIPDEITYIVSPQVLDPNTGEVISGGTYAIKNSLGIWVGSLPEMKLISGNSYTFLLNASIQEPITWDVNYPIADDDYFYIENIPLPPEEEPVRPIEAFENPISYIVTDELPNPYYDKTHWDGFVNKFPSESSVGQIFISDNQDKNLKQNCQVELNTGNIIGKTINDSTGNGSKGLLMGDYKVKKVRKGEPMRRDSFEKLPRKTNNRDGAL